MSQMDRMRLTDLDKASTRKPGAQTDAPAVTSDSEVIGTPGLNARQNAVLRMQRTLGNAAVQRMLVQRAKVDAPAGVEGGPIDDQVQSQINSARGSGSTLPEPVAAQMGSSLGADFSDVHVHTDGQSDTLNRSLAAKAFTTGSDIFFSSGEYQPSSPDGQKLLAHELTHVVQQSGSAPSGPLTLGPAEDSYESEADSMASQAMSSAPPASSAQREECEGCGESVQRAPDEDDDAMPGAA